MRKMTKKIIDSRFLGSNVRSSPTFGSEHVIGFFRQGTPVTITGPQTGDRWLPCLLEIDGTDTDAFISKNMVRDPVSDAREALARYAVDQWFRFDKGRGKEHIDPYAGYVSDFWQVVGLDLTGRNRDVPWSAAFISACVNGAGDSGDFELSALHAKYVNQAIRKRLDTESGLFLGYRVTEKKPDVGDIVCRRRTSANITYDFASTNNGFSSHCDIVIRVTDDFVTTIGGNVSHTVSRVNYPLTDEGFLEGPGRVFALMVHQK